MSIVDHLSGSDPAAVGVPAFSTVRGHPYPYVNDWRRGCWVARPNGKADRDYVYDRVFLRGTPVKADGVVRYSLGALGGRGWVVAKGSRGRELVFCDELEWFSFGEVRAADILEIVRGARSWDGSKCPTCGVGALFESAGLCRPCLEDLEDLERSAATRAGQPGGEVF